MKKFNPKKTKYLDIVNGFINLFFHTPKAEGQIDWMNINRILVIDFTGIGDLIMLLPFLRILKKNSPNAFVDLACNGFAETLIGDQGLIRKFYPIKANEYINHFKKMFVKDATFQSYVKQIKQETYDVIIEPRGDLRYIYFMHLLKGKRKISYTYTGGQAFLTDPIEPDEEVKHLKEDKLVLLRKIGCKFSQADEIPFLEISKKRKEFNDSFCIKKSIKRPVVGIHPGASQDLRRWDKYPDLVEKIFSEHRNLVFLVFSAKGEEQYAEQIKIKGDKIGCNMQVVNENLDNYISLLSLCDLLVCNDSGAAHIGAALGVPVCVLYGPNVPSFSCPTGRNSVINISNDLPCKPCGLDICKFEINKCMQSISVDQVYESITPFLKMDIEG